MPKTAKDYESFDAYVSSILLKRDNREGMFAGWTQESADTEQMIPLLRQYKAQLERENAPEALINQVDRFSKAVYAPKAVSTHKAMSKKDGMVVTNVNEMVREVFEVTGFADILDIE